jgi:putative ABC transport system permease protein
MISRWLRTFQLGFKSLLMHKLRSTLAMIGILIGVTAVIWLVALGEGVSEQAQRQIQQLGARNVIIKSTKPARDANSSSAGGRVAVYGITRDDYDRIVTTIPSVERAVPMREILREAAYRHRITDCQLVGCTADYYQINHLTMDRGRFITDSDLESRDNICVLSAAVAKELFPFEEPLGKSIQLIPEFYTVVGIVEDRAPSAAIGGSLAGRSYDQDVYIPISTFRSRFGDHIVTSGSGALDAELVELNQVTVTVDTIEHVEAVADIIAVLFEKFHDKEDYTITVPKELIRQAERLRSLFNVLLVLIAGISLMVGGIGIMNIMLATVTERTREIGVRRALGARRKDIIAHFLAETIVLTGTGGFLGVGVGFLCRPAVKLTQGRLQEWWPETWNSIPPEIQSLEPIIAPWSVGVAFGISVVVGLIFGLYPARQAAMMDPIEALRHE